MYNLVLGEYPTPVRVCARGTVNSVFGSLHIYVFEKTCECQDTDECRRSSPPDPSDIS